jgi:hypothetical protein
MKASLVLVCGSLCFTPLLAADVYRWVDETGRTQYSDVVPERYKSAARRVDTRPLVTDEEFAAAQEREARDRLESGEWRRSPEMSPVGGLGSGTGAPSAGEPAQPAPAATGGNACATQHQAYRESQECFAPFRTVTGAVKPEAFNVCGAPVLDPSPQCGPPPAY